MKISIDIPIPKSALQRIVYELLQEVPQRVASEITEAEVVQYIQKRLSETGWHGQIHNAIGDQIFNNPQFSAINSWAYRNIIEYMTPGDESQLSAVVGTAIEVADRLCTPVALSGGKPAAVVGDAPLRFSDNAGAQITVAWAAVYIESITRRGVLTLMQADGINSRKYLVNKKDWHLNIEKSADKEQVQLLLTTPAGQTKHTAILPCYGQSIATAKLAIQEFIKHLQ